MAAAKSRRFYEIDLARALPLLFLPIVHVYEEFGLYDMLTPGALELGKFWLYACIMGPSVFMMVLGMNIAFSSHTSPAQLFRRGLITVGLFFGLNFCRGTIPGILAYCVRPEPILFKVIPYVFFQSDILMFAGLAFLFFALMKKLKLPPVVIFAITLLMLAVGTFIAPEQSSLEPDSVWSAILGNFYRVDEGSVFPALVWMVYPAVGYLLGTTMVKIPDEAGLRRFYNRLLVLGVTMLAALSLCLLSYDLDPLNVSAAVVNSNTTDLFNVIMDVGIGFVWFGLIYYIWNAIRSEKVKAAAVKVSKAIMIFYMAQWVLVGWSELGFAAFFYLENCLQFWVVALVSVIIAALSLLIALPIQRKLENKKKSKKTKAAEA